MTFIADMSDSGSGNNPEYMLCLFSSVVLLSVGKGGEGRAVLLSATKGPVCTSYGFLVAGCCGVRIAN